MMRPQTSVREIEALLTAAMQVRYPTHASRRALAAKRARLALLRALPTQGGRQTHSTTEEAEAMLAELEKQYEIT
jgi:hypothetical protein